MVYGRVFERIGVTTQPIAGAVISLQGGAGDPPAETNEAGFYAVCTVTSWDEIQTVTAQKNGYAAATREIAGGGYPDLDFELVRN